VGSYVGVILGLWALPTLGKGVVGFFVAVGGIVRDISIGGVGAALVSFFPLLWFALTLVVVLLLPLVTPVLWVGMLSRSTAAKAQQHGAGVVAVCTVAPVVIVAVAFVATLAPPHAEMVDRIAAAHDDASRQALLDDRNAISAALVDAHLARHRTFSSLDAVDARNAWAHEWNEFVPTPVAETIGNFAAGLARPFIFQGTTADIAAAGQLHRDFFGTHLERAHAKAVQQALSATWSREQRYAGFINEGQRRVRLVRQDVSAKSAGGVATVEVHDEWSNLTLADEEVALFFELPESAALTGLWLSPTGNRDEAFAAVVAPRGAAQQVYREQLEKRRDPALLEQVGPRQYRLRVFPVPARHIDRDRGSFFTTTDAWRNVENQPRQHVWLSYEAFVDGDGVIPFPRLRERRNGFWDTATVRTVNGIAVDAAADGAADDAADDVGAAVGYAWVQGEVKGDKVDVFEAAAFGRCFRFARQEQAEIAGGLAGKNVDVIVDRSLAMETERQHLAAALTALRASGARLSFVLGTSKLRHESAVAAAAVDAVDVTALQFYGAASLKELIEQYAGLAAPQTTATTNDALVVLTSEGSFDVADDAGLVLPQGFTLPKTVVVHLGGRFPAGYDDVTIDTIRRGGGTAVSNVDEAIARLRGGVRADGFAISTCAAAVEGRGRALVARQAILAADRGGGDVASLDELHNLAKQASVVSPYSSMICLVDEAQRQRLKELEAQQDRFDREVEDGAEAAPAGDIFNVQGVPEPAEWLLLLLAMAATTVMVRRPARRGATVRRRSPPSLRVRPHRGA